MIRQVKSILLLLALLFLFVYNAFAEEPNYSLDWWTVDGGGGMSSRDSGYTLSSSIGQPEAGVWGDGYYVFEGGFLSGTLAGYRIYLPLLIRGS